MVKGRIKNAIIISTITLSLLPWKTCSRRDSASLPTFTIRRPEILVKNVRSDYLIHPRYDPTGELLIFNGRLPGDAYDAIYLIPNGETAPRKIFATNESAFAPALSFDRQKVVFSLGSISQICLYNIPTGTLQRLPIFGRTPSFLPDDETILYTSLTDGNIRLYHLPSRRSRILTYTDVISNHSPLLFPDRAKIIYLENFSRAVQQISQITLDSLHYQTLRRFPSTLSAISISPSGGWLLGSQPTGDPLAFSLTDPSLQPLPVAIESIEPQKKLLAHSICWSPKGEEVVFVGNQTLPFSQTNPYLRAGKYCGDIVRAQLQWHNLDDATVLQSPPIKQLTWSPTQFNAPSTPSASRFVPQESNNPPRIISSPPTIAYSEELYIYQLESVEIDLQDNLEYTLINGPAEAELQPRSGTLLWTPGDTGTYAFTVRVQDSRLAADFQNFSVAVKPKNRWRQASYRPKTKNLPPAELSASLRFLDPDNDGYLSAGENAALQINLRPVNSYVIDSVRVVMILSATVDEVALQREVLFDTCQPGRWTTQTIPMVGQPALRNRPIIINAVAHTSNGLRPLPVSLVINGKNPQAASFHPGRGAPGTF